MSFFLTKNRIFAQNTKFYKNHPSHQKNEDSEDEKTVDSDSTHDEFSDSMMNTATEMDLDENDGNLTDESDHDLPATPPNEEKQQVSPLWPTKFAKHCEPTIRFIRSKEEVADDLKLSQDQLSMLKWQGSKICPKIMKSLLSKTGFKIYKHTKQWIGYYGKHMKSPLFEKFQAGQHVNHFPGTFELGRKDRLFRNVNRLAAKRTRNVSSHKLHMINSSSTFSASQISQGSTKNYNSIYRGILIFQKFRFLGESIFWSRHVFFWILVLFRPFSDIFGHFRPSPRHFLQNHSVQSIVQPNLQLCLLRILSSCIKLKPKCSEFE